MKPQPVERLNDNCWPWVAEFPITMQFYGAGVMLQTDLGMLGEPYAHNNGDVLGMLRLIAYAYLNARFPETHIWRHPDYSRVHFAAADQDPWYEARRDRGR